MKQEMGKVPFALAGIDHIVFIVDDMQVAMDFYLNVLGCQRGYAYPELGMEQVWAGNVLVVLWDHTHPGGAGAKRQLLAVAMLIMCVWPQDRLIMMRCGRIWPRTALKLSAKRCMAAHAAWQLILFP